MAKTEPKTDLPEIDMFVIKSVHLFINFKQPCNTSRVSSSISDPAYYALGIQSLIYSWSNNFFFNI